MTIAATIHAQLGGNKFVAMTDAKSFVAGERDLTFRIGRNLSKANMIRITLRQDDTYSVEFMRYANLDVNTLRTADGVTVEGMRAVISDYTGLRLSL